MKLVMLAVYDDKAKIYGMPHFMRTKGEALREWATECNRAESQISKFPADFTLFEVGIYDDQTGKTEAHPTPMSLGLALEYKNKPTNQMELLPNEK